MARCHSKSALAVLVFAGIATITGQAQALDVRCQREGLVRNVEVRFAQDADGLPCRVLWQDPAGSDRGQLVWHSVSRLDFCTDKARELVHQLIDEGWTCEAGMTASSDRSAPGPVVRLEPAAPEPDAALPLRPEPATPAHAHRSPPRPMARLEPTAPEPDAALRLRPEPPSPAQTAPPAKRTQEGGPRPGRAVLQTALARDVARLDQLAAESPGSFQVKTALLGDLDGNGIDDAVALLTHRADGAPPSHHLLAYLFDGETFQPVARLALEESSNARIQQIVDGVIEVLLDVPQPGDLACCPSGRRRATFVLRDHALVKLAEERSGA